MSSKGVRLINRAIATAVYAETALTARTSTVRASAKRARARAHAYVQHLESIENIAWDNKKKALGLGRKK